MYSLGVPQGRLRGARHARGHVLVFVDSHCEVLRDWLRPLLQRVREKQTAVVTPILDAILTKTFLYDPSDEYQVREIKF